MPGSRRKSASTQGHTYVIDQSYRVVYLDRAARRVFPGGRVGELCYECFRGQSEPCKDCPWNAESNEHATQSVIYSARTGSWYEITCLELDWFNEGPCVLFSGHPVDEHSRSLFTSLSEPSSYDELFELNLTDDAYKILYHEPGKFTTPPLEGRISDMFPDVRDRMIHPEDRDRFHAFWDFDTLLDRIEQAGGALRGEFRKHLESGAWSWTSLTVAPVKRGGSGERVVMCFIADIEEEMQRRTDQAERSQIQLLRERDQLTGLYNAATFYDKAEHLVADMPDIAYDAAYIDIEHFKIYNEWHGREAGDAILRAIASRIGEIARKHGGIAGYLGGDDFTLLLPHGLIDEKRVESELKKEPFDSEDTIGFQPAFGVCAIDSPDVSVVTACDHAMIAMNSVKGAYTKRIAWYEAEMTEEMETEAKILLEVKRALTNHEFVLHWQPQCNTRTERIAGLEALVRWQHPSRGIVMPGAFIPVLERNNFIASLDLYVWEEACRHIRSWIDRGGVPIPVSVNISRADLYAIDVVEALEGLVSRYDLDHRLLELEITESAYAEDEKMADAVARLKGLGFTILMDDFGSGYSSLNMLKDITVDILKIDMGFLARQDQSQRSESILEAIVSMARFMDLRIIAEGAETKEQVDFLQGIGCDYAQGYYFYRPMSTEALEQLLSQDGIVDYRGVLNPSMELIDVNALLHDDMVSRAAVNNLIGGLAVYAVYADRFELLQVNNEYYHVTGCNSIDLRERQNRISRQVHPDDLPLVQSMFAEAYERPVTGAEATFRRYRLNGEIMWMRMRAFFLRREQDRTIFFASLADVTEQKQQEDELRESQAVLELEDEVLHRIIQQSDLNVWVYDIASDRLSFQNLSSNGIASLLAASADEEDTASLGDDVSNVLRRLSRETLWGRPASRTIKVWSNTGEPLTLHIEREIVPDANGKPARVIGYLEDPLNDSRAKLTRSDDNRLLDILKGAAVDHWYINVNTKSFLNSADRRAWRYWAGISLDDWSSSMLEDRLGKYIGPSQDAEAIENFLDFDDMLQRFADGERNDSLEYRLGENDDERWMELSYRMVQLEEDGYVYAYLSVTDIDERKRRELDLEDKAEHDALTGLLNRQSASVRMANALERTLQRGYRGAFAIIDLDDFKQVNDRYGHLSGDTVLADVAQHLCGAFRKGDLICRWGGDEFVVYCEDMERDDIERRLVELSEGPWNATLPDNRVIELSVSTGIAMVPQDGIAFKTVYERADRALYRAKSKGKAHFCFFEADKDS
ncbi:diguanylate cyclase [Eggerthella lenta]|uniref:EAL domain-containing protein n=1 Tax=Eggerthella lenta TaxID=84112 RepID=UPI000DF81616|nr:EAL domain-containing protein [Eggerthella lenta]RDC40384.1 diguanylate cyclase [Eggerthella lenta]